MTAVIKINRNREECGNAVSKRGGNAAYCISAASFFNRNKKTAKHLLFNK
jgi:hypothetical protein